MEPLLGWNNRFDTWPVYAGLDRIVHYIYSVDIF